MARDVHSREQNEIMRQLGLLALVVMLAVVVMMIPLGGALAGLWHGGRWAWPSGAFITTMRDIVLHPNRPAQAYPSDIRSALPGPVGYWASVAALEALLLFTAVFVIVLSAVWPTLISTVDAVRSVNPTYVNLAATLGTPWWSRLWNVWLPASLPGIVTGLRLSLSTSWLVIIAAEMLVGGQGIGFFVWTMWNRLDIDAIVVAIVLIGVIGLVLDHLVSAVQKVVRHD